MQMHALEDGARGGPGPDLVQTRNASFTAKCWRGSFGFGQKCLYKEGGGQWCYGGGQVGYTIVARGVKGRVGKISAPPVPQNTERSHFQLLPHSQIGIFFSKPTNTKDNLDWCPK